MISSKQISKAVMSLENDGNKSEVVLEKLLKFVSRYDLESSLPQIFENLRKESAKQNSDKTLFIETPFEASGQAIEKIKEIAQVPEQALLSKKIEKKLIGGFRAYFQDRKYDGSVLNSLNKLEEKLKEN